MTYRRKLSPKQRQAMYDEQGGKCYCHLVPSIHPDFKNFAPCGGLPLGEGWIVEHGIALAAGGSNDDENLFGLRKACAKMKTVIDTRRITKTKHMAGETGQQAKRKKRKAEGKPSPWGNQKKKIPSRPFPKRSKRD